VSMEAADLDWELEKFAEWSLSSRVLRTISLTALLREPSILGCDGQLDCWDHWLQAELLNRQIHEPWAGLPFQRALAKRLHRLGCWPVRPNAPCSVRLRITHLTRPLYVQLAKSSSEISRS
jgi:hypothetical protein